MKVLLTSVVSNMTFFDRRSYFVWSTSGVPMQADLRTLTAKFFVLVWRILYPVIKLIPSTMIDEGHPVPVSYVKGRMLQNLHENTFNE